jgi:hypothetical protein
VSPVSPEKVIKEQAIFRFIGHSNAFLRSSDGFRGFGRFTI